MGKTKGSSVEIQRGFVLGYIALGVVVMTTGLVMSVSSGRGILASLSSNQQIISGTTSYGASSNSMEGKDVIIKSTGKLTLAGAHNFNSLTVDSGGTISQDALTASDFDATSGELTQTGKDKKVDLTITGSATINGTIDVSGKGFPAFDSTKIPADCATNKNCKTGYGPGGGSNFDSHNERTYAAGGGHGGKGANARMNNTLTEDFPGAYKNDALGGSPYDSDVAPVLPGSAGGSARAHAISRQNSNGGKGGGVVHLKTGTLTMGSQGSIMANGAPGACTTATCGGGGSGGSVFIEITNMNSQTNPITASVKAGAPPAVAKGIAENGSLKSSGVTVGSGNKLQANGGGGTTSGAGNYMSPGGGGRISVVATQAATPTPAPVSCPEVDLTKVTTSAWTQSWFTVDPNDKTKCLATLQQNYMCSLGWCGGSANTAYQSDWKTNLLYISGYDSSGTPQGYSDYVGFNSARKIVIPATAVYEFSLASDDIAEVFVDSETTPVVTSDKTTVASGINPNKVQKTLTAGEHIIKLNYRELDGAASLYFSISKVATADRSIQLPGGYTAFDIPQSWGVVKVQDVSMTGITLFAFNWLADQQWARNVQTLHPGIGYYIYTPQAMTLNLDNQPSVTPVTPVIKKGWNLLSNSTPTAFDMTSAVFRAIKPGTTGDCKSAACSDQTSISSLVSAKRAYSNIYLITGPNATTAAEAFTILDTKSSSASIPANTDFWIYLWE